ncbi:MAG: DNA cytosine methyltransferase [Candidatus Parvarchaeum sp.]
MMPSDLDEHIVVAHRTLAKAIQTYFDSDKTLLDAQIFCKTITPSISLQRMFAYTKDLLDNQVIIHSYSTNGDLEAHVTSMLVIDYLRSILASPDSDYTVANGTLLAADFGAPQKRSRFIMMGVQKNICSHIELPKATVLPDEYNTIRDAISDLEDIPPLFLLSDPPIPLPFPLKGTSSVLKGLRDSRMLYNHLIANNTPIVKKRFETLTTGGSFHTLPPELKSNYLNPNKSFKNLYIVMDYDQPSLTIGHIGKLMWSHPTLSRGFSIREVARLQTFPDSFIFCGTKYSQYQQIANAVPPILGKAIGDCIYSYLSGSKLDNVENKKMYQANLFKNIGATKCM